jgi:hypothetical protein
MTRHILIAIAGVAALMFAFWLAGIQPHLLCDSLPWVPNCR